jgi:hypothetical protein
MNRRTFNATAVTAPLLAGCVYGQYFDIEWDEEVLLHDGRMIVVHVKRTFERRSRFDRWEGMHRDTEISFDAGGKIGQFTKTLQRYDLAFLHCLDGAWYFALGVTTGTPPVQLVTQDKSIMVLTPNRGLTSIYRTELPTEFKTYNIMPLTPSSEGVAKFHQKKLTITEKKAHWSANLRAAGDGPDVQIPDFKKLTQGTSK